MRPLWLPAYIAIGSNLGQPRQRVAEAFERLAALPDTLLELKSPAYLTRPVGPQNQPDFVNAAAGLLTRLPARKLLDELQGIERAMGRDRREQAERWGPRVLDLDLLWMTGSAMNEPGLTLPHPGVSRRNFVLYPLNDIAPTLLIPGHGRVMSLWSGVSGDGISLL